MLIKDICTDKYHMITRLQLLAIIFILCLPSSIPALVPDKAFSAVYISGPEFGNRNPNYSNANPGVEGRDYWFNTEKTFDYFAKKGFGVFRIPLMWERLQPEPGGALNASYLYGIRKNISWAQKNNARVILDLMNQGRYSLLHNGKIVKACIGETIGDEVLITPECFAGLWKRLSLELSCEIGVLGYGLMNEPHDMTTPGWKSISQSAVNAIRETGDAKLILVNGDAWSTCDGWLGTNSEPWISDLRDNFVYEASCFLDYNGSGAYLIPFEEERKKDGSIMMRGVDHSGVFMSWCSQNKVKGHIASTGVPWNDQGWFPVIDSMLAKVMENKFGWSYWSAGEWWKTYKLTIQPRGDFSEDMPQLKIITQYIYP
jgi:endoglucanase